MEKERMLMTIECNREVESLYELDIEVNENQKQHIQNLINEEEWDDIIELLKDKYNIDVYNPNRDEVFDESILEFHTHRIYTQNQII